MPTGPTDAISFEIDAGLAFGTGQHATTAGCLAALDRLETSGKRFANIADIGTGTGLLAFAAMALWPEAKAIATDIDQIAVDVTDDNARINGVRLGHGAGELLLAVADGMDHPLIAARAPFDLLDRQHPRRPADRARPRLRQERRARRKRGPRRPARHPGRRGHRGL